MLWQQLRQAAWDPLKEASGIYVVEPSYMDNHCKLAEQELQREKQSPSKSIFKVQLIQGKHCLRKEYIHKTTRHRRRPGLSRCYPILPQHMQCKVKQIN